MQRSEVRGQLAPWGAGLNWCHTGFELDPDSGVVLDLLDHLSIPADHDADGEARNGDLDRK